MINLSVIKVLFCPIKSIIDNGLKAKEYLYGKVFVGELEHECSYVHINRFH